jgi:hypothetical protein
MKDETVLPFERSIRLRNDDQFLYDSMVEIVKKMAKDYPEDFLNDKPDENDTIAKACVLLSFGIHNSKTLSMDEVHETANSLLTRLKNFVTIKYDK